MWSCGLAGMLLIPVFVCSSIGSLSLSLSLSLLLPPPPRLPSRSLIKLGWMLKIVGRLPERWRSWNSWSTHTSLGSTRSDYMLATNSMFVRGDYTRQISYTCTYVVSLPVCCTTPGVTAALKRCILGEWERERERERLREGERERKRKGRRERGTCISYVPTESPFTKFNAHQNYPLYDNYHLVFWKWLLSDKKKKSLFWKSLLE